MTWRRRAKEKRAISHRNENEHVTVHVTSLNMAYITQLHWSNACLISIIGLPMSFSGGASLKLKARRGRRRKLSLPWYNAVNSNCIHVIRSRICFVNHVIKGGFLKCRRLTPADVCGCDGIRYRIYLWNDIVGSKRCHGRSRYWSIAWLQRSTETDIFRWKISQSNYVI